MTDATGTLSYDELRTAVAGCAQWLDAMGVAPGDRVVYAAPSDRRFLVFLYASLQLGAVFVPVHPDLTTPQLGYIVSNCRPSLVVCGPTLAPAVGAPVISADSAWAHVVAVDPSQPPVAPAAVGPDDNALLIYTSGTTGHPKGVVCPHRQVLAATEAINSCLGYRTDDVVLCRLPMSFDYGLYQALLCASVGATLVLADRASDLALPHLLDRHQVTVVPLVPSLAQMLIVTQRRRAVATRVRLFTNTGARLGRDTVAALLEHFPLASYASMYGMTECKRISILDVSEYAEHPDSVGRALPGDAVRILDPEGIPVPPLTRGEIVVSGATVMAGYWQVPIEDQRRYVRCPDGSLELHTGDQGYLDADGRLYFVGRDDDIIKRCGIRISLTEIENAAELVPGVSAAVALRPEPEDGPLHLAVVSEVSAESIRRQLAVRLDHARLPTRITQVAVLPLTPNGKPDRAGVQRLLDQHSAPDAIVPGPDPSSPDSPTTNQTGLHHEPIAV